MTVTNYSTAVPLHRNLHHEHVQYGSRMNLHSVDHSKARCWDGHLRSLEHAGTHAEETARLAGNSSPSPLWHRGTALESKCPGNFAANEFNSGIDSHYRERPEADYYGVETSGFVDGVFSWPEGSLYSGSSLDAAPSPQLYEQVPSAISKYPFASGTIGLSRREATPIYPRWSPTCHNLGGAILECGVGMTDEAAQHVGHNRLDLVCPITRETLATEHVPVSAGDLSGWLAESVWKLLLDPFVPVIRGCGGQGLPRSYKVCDGPLTPPNGPVVDDRRVRLYEHSSPFLYSTIPADVYDVQSGRFCAPYGPTFGRQASDHASELLWHGSSNPRPHIPTLCRRNPYNLPAKVPSSFVDFVFRTLSQTLLSPTAIVLSLWYIRRMAIHCEGQASGAALRQALALAVSSPGGLAGEEAARRVVVLGLACSNKWLDDNTFTNKSWSEVTALPLTELNRLEILAIGSPEVNFDLSISMQEWQAWVEDVDRSVASPFATDARLVRDMIHNDLYPSLRATQRRHADEVERHCVYPVTALWSSPGTWDQSSDQCDGGHGCSHLSGGDQAGNAPDPARQAHRVSQVYYGQWQTPHPGAKLELAEVSLSHAKGLMDQERFQTQLFCSNYTTKPPPPCRSYHDFGVPLPSGGFAGDQSPPDAFFADVQFREWDLANYGNDFLFGHMQPRQVPM